MFFISHNYLLGYFYFAKSSKFVINCRTLFEFWNIEFCIWTHTNCNYPPYGSTQKLCNAWTNHFLRCNRVSYEVKYPFQKISYYWDKCYNFELKHKFPIFLLYEGQKNVELHNPIAMKLPFERSVFNYIITWLDSAVHYKIIEKHMQLIVSSIFRKKKLTAKINDFDNFLFKNV